MSRAIVLFTCLASVILGLTLAVRLSADTKEEAQKRLTEKASKFEYPGGKPFGNYNVGAACQSVLTTPDDLDTVDKWYRKALTIQPAEGTGVSSRTRILDGDTPKERSFEVQRSLYINDQKPKDDDPRQKVSQAATVRSYVVKEPEYTLVVVATRPRDEKATQISVTFMPEAAK
jgi:hypothetical protein